MAENIIDIVYERIKFDKDKLKSGELQRIEVDSFNLSDFWSQYGAAVQALSNEVTKIGFMCGKKPYPSTEEMSGLMQEMMQYYTVARDLYLVLPAEVGAEVFKAVTSAMLAIMAALLDIVHSLRELSEKGAKNRLMLTGTFWDTCNAVETLPRNNLTAVMKAVFAEAELAKDALDELTAEKDTGQATSVHKQVKQKSKPTANSESGTKTAPVREQKASEEEANKHNENKTCKLPANLKEASRSVQSVPPKASPFISQLIQQSTDILNNKGLNQAKITQAMTWEQSNNSNRIQQLLPAEQLQGWASRNTSIPAIDYVEAKRWIHQQITNKQPVTVVALDKQINKVSSQIQKSLEKNTSKMSVKTKKSFNDSKFNKMTKLKKLLLVKQIFSRNPPNFLFNKVNTSSFTKTATSVAAMPSNEVMQSESINVRVQLEYGYSSTTKVIDYNHSSVGINQLFGCQAHSSGSLVGNYLQEMVSKFPKSNTTVSEIRNSVSSTYSGSSEAISTQPTLSETISTRPTLSKTISTQPTLSETISTQPNSGERQLQMFLPTPTQNCSAEFIKYFPNLEFAQLFENIEKRNPGLKSKGWKVYMQWRDGTACNSAYYAMVGVDEASFRVLEAQNFSARVTHHYYSYFSKC